MSADKRPIVLYDLDNNVLNITNPNNSKTEQLPMSLKFHELVKSRKISKDEVRAVLIREAKPIVKGGRPVVRVK